MSLDSSLLEIDSLTVRRGANEILSHLSLSVSAGAPFAITGESGSGKSTLLFAIAGLLAPHAGTIRVQSQPISGITNRERARIVGLVFQDYQLFPHFSVRENILLATKLHQIKGAAESAQELLAELHMDQLADRYPHELSGGQRQRVALARSLILSPRLLLLDEPSAALDAKTSKDLAVLLERLNKRSQILVVSHDISFLDLFCTRRLSMSKGRLIGNTNA